MPIDLPVPQIAQAATMFDRCLITGFEVQENSPNTGAPITPVLIIYWVKLDKASGNVLVAGQYRISPTVLASERPDGTLTFRANLKARLYKVLQDDGVFPSGRVT